MVEIKLDLSPGSLEPATNHDTFISVRVGELQKLSRLANSRTYRFPKISDKQQGRIEVYKRVAHVPFHVNPLNDGATEVNMNLLGSNEKVGFRVDINADENTKEKARQAQKVTDADPVATKTSMAKDYLQMHCIEACLSEAMQALLREKPDNPTEFLANALLRNGPAPVKVPKPVAPTSPTMDKSVPAPTACVPAATTTGTQYGMESLRKEAEAALVQASMDGRLQKAFADCAAQKLGGPSTIGKIMPDSAWSSIYSKFPTKNPAKPPVSSLLPFKAKTGTAMETPKGKFDLKPSVGTWLAVTPFNASVAAAAEEKRELACAGPKKGWAKMPSTGTWVQPLLYKGKNDGDASATKALTSAATCAPTGTSSAGNGKMVVPARQVFGPNFLGGGLMFI